MTLETYDLTLHGRRVRLHEHLPGADAGDEAIVLLHGIAGSAETWTPVLQRCAALGRRLLAPDLPGHGESDAPRTDYGLGAMASIVRDVLAVSGVRHATVVGHSLGGGIAMQFAYQFPEMCDRLVLVGSAGLGPEVSPVLRATALPGARIAVALAVNRWTLAIARAAARIGRRLGGSLKPETRELARHFGSLADPGRRRAFLAIARGLIDLRGQRASAVEKLYLAESVPVLLVWGARDPLIPAVHGHRTAALLPDSRLTVLENVKHFPHVADPDRFCLLLNEFVSETTPARLTLDDVVARLLARNPVREAS
ncbi:pimeloyl-ACP methyl ester carboxylesterase [Amycolatopsis lexingtonensis]|uniref:Pimeloyl-ACP methyl ester carboxylesterase n=1 Tax=Amycolatopsis lexingtonensis TaxID=218822 RepID=A0ABR9IEC4_9PSEU|nr:alpha/beta fold hydrolase [Amycolatopsis lexingtonensis]MBE1501542.1 pimeloyl-ACP methyl ester carboxylesterase [Amycolatopsis lexingtonensis]